MAANRTFPSSTSILSVPEMAMNVRAVQPSSQWENMSILFHSSFITSFVSSLSWFSVQLKAAITKHSVPFSTSLSHLVLLNEPCCRLRAFWPLWRKSILIVSIWEWWSVVYSEQLVFIAWLTQVKHLRLILRCCSKLTVTEWDPGWWLLTRVLCRRPWSICYQCRNSDWLQRDTGACLQPTYRKKGLV